MPRTSHLSAWFCLRTQSKHEHIAAACLRADFAIETCLPRIRFRRPTRRGPVQFTEALFPNYLFARFNLSSQLLAVQNSHAVRGIVHFGGKWPSVPEATISGLRTSLGDSEVLVIPDQFEPGQLVEIAGGAFHGLSAVVLRVMPARERVAVLLDFLGRQTTVELAQDALVLPGLERISFRENGPR